MASSHRHWRARLDRLAAAPTLTRAGRRQLRKLLGRLWQLEWRKSGWSGDALDKQILENTVAGHVAQRLRTQSEPQA